MAQKERLGSIKQKIVNERTVTVSALSKEYGVTEETIRRDLEKLEKQGVLTRTHGGAVLNSNLTNQHSIHFNQRLQINSEAKKAIAEKAFALLSNESVIGVDASSTVMELIRKLKGDGSRTIFTNSVVALFECFQSDLNVLSSGGYLNKSSLSLQGIVAQNMIANYYMDIAFISCKAISYEKGIFDTNENESAIKQSLVRQSKKVVLLADATKFDEISFVKVLDLKMVHVIVTDQRPSAEWEDFCKRKGIQLVF